MGDQRAIVIGAGIAGASAAFALARRGVEVTVVDDGVYGQATAASAGIIMPWVSLLDGPFYELYAAGAAFYPELLEHLAAIGVTKTDYRRTGSLVVNADLEVLEQAEERIRSRKAALAAVGRDTVGAVERIDNAAARELFPPLDPGLHTLHVEGGGRVDGRTMRDALLDGATRLGARRITGHATLDQNRVRVGDETLEADAIVAAAGAWSTELLESVGYNPPLAPQKGQITHLRVEADTGGWPTINPVSHHYIVSFDEGRVVVGATRENDSGFDTRVTAEGQLQLLQDAFSIAPGLADATFIETRVGLRPYPDDLPVAGPIPERPGLYVASGYGAAGLTMGPLVGDAIARSVLGEDAPELGPIAPTPR